jgi:hypothetical protein
VVFARLVETQQSGTPKGTTGASYAHRGTLGGLCLLRVMRGDRLAHRVHLVAVLSHSGTSIFQAKEDPYYEEANQDH